MILYPAGTIPQNYFSSMPQGQRPAKADKRRREPSLRFRNFFRHPLRLNAARIRLSPPNAA
jgi:hypothetical protein